MKWSNFVLPTFKEDPADAESLSHKLMVRAGLIQRLQAGVYSYLPLGFKVLKKVQDIIREEMNAVGAQEVLLPALHPSSIWKDSGRYEQLGADMFKIKDRHMQEMVLGPTHEEIITDLVARTVKSYKQLPVILYQIQTKFRDEARPRFGVIRSKEFIMKDAYSFDADVKAMQESYEKVKSAYVKIFQRCGLNVTLVNADPGVMGGNKSQEFAVLSESGEDEVVVCAHCHYSASREAAEYDAGGKKEPGRALPREEVATPGKYTVEDISAFFKVPPKKLLKTLIYVTQEGPVACLVLGDRQLNEAKLARHLKTNTLHLADEKTILEATGAPMGFSGPAGLKNIRIVADREVALYDNYIAGANKKDAHLKNVNVGRDFEAKEYADISYPRAGDACPQCKKPLAVNVAIELGHIFQLGTKYSQALGASFLDKDGKNKPLIMGCYGVGVNRIVASVIEQSHDEQGIIWPESIAPFRAVLIPIASKVKDTMQEASRLYEHLCAQGYDVLFDDRDVTTGVKFKDADLIGIPLRMVLSEATLREGKIELMRRKDKEKKLVPLKDLTEKPGDYL
jgi:prolyl-tRNA synthetase